MLITELQLTITHQDFPSSQVICKGKIFTGFIKRELEQQMEEKVLRMVLFLESEFQAAASEQAA